jgi:hypothetical protein
MDSETAANEFAGDSYRITNIAREARCVALAPEQGKIVGAELR